MTTVTSSESNSSSVVPIAGLTGGDVERAGAKAANLGELARTGFPVPEGFVLTTDAFERFLEENSLNTDSTPESVRAAVLPPDIAEGVRAVNDVLGDGPFAVRSSGVGEDLAGASFAGQYETVLGVHGEDAVLGAVKQCWTSAFSSRVAAYRQPKGQPVQPLAVLIQRLVPAEAAGVALTANPVTGDREEVLVSAVRGLGERLVSGEAQPDEWLVRGKEVTCRALPEGAISENEVLAVAELGRAVEAHFGGVPQDVEWALADNNLFLLQARPITALPERVDWQAGPPGAFARNFRLGEWLGDPVTPLFATWLLPRLEERLYHNYRQIAGVPAPRPPSVIVHGWYFASLNFLPASPARMLWMVLRHVLPRALVHPRRAAMANPSTAKFGVEIFVREWCNELLPRYRRLVDQAAGEVERRAPGDLVRLIENLATVAGDYFTSITLVAGFAWKAEVPLATFYRRHLAPRVAGSYQRLLGGLADVTPSTPEFAVTSLDWFHPTFGELGLRPALDETEDENRRKQAVAERREAEAEARALLATSSNLLAKFERLLATAQRFAAIREQQTRDLTLAWPIMRRAVLRLGAALVQRAVLEAPEDAFFLRHEELLEVLAADEAQNLAPLAAERRRQWERQRRLTPPLITGVMTPMVRKVMAETEHAFRPATGEAMSESSRTVLGLPASAGRATGPVRVVRAPAEFDRLHPGDVLVAPATTPAWTPLFVRAAAVVTDTGSPAAHASLVAREFGIPAVVGTGDATRRLVDGMPVTVDGNTGVVEMHE